MTFSFSSRATPRQNLEPSKSLMTTGICFINSPLEKACLILNRLLRFTTQPCDFRVNVLHSRVLSIINSRLTLSPLNSNLSLRNIHMIPSAPVSIFQTLGSCNCSIDVSSSSSFESFSGVLGLRFRYPRFRSVREPRWTHFTVSPHR